VSPTSTVASVADNDLDTILAVQIAVARLGEKPFRFWWNSDIADVDGGADLLGRMVGAEMTPLAVADGLLLTARRAEARFLAEIPAPQAYSFFLPEPALRVALQRRLRHFKTYPDDLPQQIASLLTDTPSADDLVAAVERSTGAIDAAEVTEEQTRFGIEVIMPAGTGNNAADRASSARDTAVLDTAAVLSTITSLTRVALRSPRGAYTLGYYRATVRG